MASSEHTAKTGEQGMALDNEQIVRQAYQIAEVKNLEGWAAAFTEDGTFTDMSIGVTFRGPHGLPEPVENYARAFPDMHRELYQIYVSGDIVVVQLALQGTHHGPLHLLNVISSYPPPVFDVHDATAIRRVARGGRGYLAPSITQMTGGFGARAACGDAVGCGVMDGSGS
jgi:hypothetical protein